MPLCGQTGRAVVSGPPTLTFQELITAADLDPVPAALQGKMDTLFNTPFISNSAGSSGATVNERGFHIAEWNIYRTPQDTDAELALMNAPGFAEKAGNNPEFRAKKLTALKEQLSVLRQADIVVLNEIDDGVDREHYHDVPRNLAEALHMNYAFAVEFLELNRIYMGLKNMDEPDKVHAGRANNFGLDPDRYLGLEGTALLSRFPIRSARIIHLPDAYDWYHDEIRALSDLEKARRWTAERIFNESIRRQVRRGGRLALIVELSVPGAPGGSVTIVCPHLEDYCSSRGRRRQIDFLLTQIRDLEGAVVIAGDLNTLGHNGRPLTINSIFRRWLLNGRFWLRQVTYFLLPVPGVGEIFQAANYFKNLHDPTAFSVPVFMSNPERHLFTDTRSFRFEDGGQLDFSGDPARSYRHYGRTLADSSERQWKGFTPTFSFEKTYGGLVGRFKLDWMFVKRASDRPAESLIPSFGRTLNLVNGAVAPRISPHSPTELEIRFDSAGVVSRN